MVYSFGNGSSTSLLPVAKRISEIILASNFCGPAPFTFYLSSCSCGGLDNESAGGQQEGEFEVFAGAGGGVWYQFTVRVKLPKEASGGLYGF